jgi:hypothetical protein
MAADPFVAGPLPLRRQFQKVKEASYANEPQGSGRFVAETYRRGRAASIGREY